MVDFQCKTRYTWEDLVEIVRLGVMSAPAVMVDGRLVVSGRAPNVKALKKLLAEQQ